MAASQPKTNIETPFTTGALVQNTDFWRQYVAARPSPAERFFEIIRDYHAEHGQGALRVAHDVGTGPGNIAERLLKYCHHVVASDLNANALAAVPELVSPELNERLTLVHSPAESLGDDGVMPAERGPGQADLVVVSECVPLLDIDRSLRAFQTLLRPQGTLAIYFYGRPIFVDGGPHANQTPAELNALYDRIATRACTFLLPFKNSPGFPMHARAAECLSSWLDNIPLSTDTWSNVERHKWNSDTPLLFNSKSGYDFDFEPVDRRAESDRTIEIHDRTWWQDSWDADRTQAYLDSLFPGLKARAGEKYVEIEKGIEELRQALGGGSAKVSFPVALILATKKY